MNLRQFQVILTQSIVLPAVTLLVIALALCLQIRNAEKTVDRLDQSNRTIAEATRTEKLIVDEESGLRGYETTHDPLFLQPYNDARQPLDESFTRLRTLAAGDSQSMQRIASLVAAHQLWQEGFAEPVLNTIQAGGGAGDVGLNLQGKRQMDAIRGDIQDIINDAEQHRSHRESLWHNEVRYSLTGLLVSALAIGLAIGLFTRNRMQKVSHAYQGTLSALRRQAQEVFESEQKLRITLSSIGDGVIVCSTEGKVEMMNGVAEELTGWTEYESLKKPLEAVFNIVNETTRQLVETPVAKVIRLNRIVGLANHTVLIRKDGSEINIDDSGAPIRDPHGVLVGIVMVFRDITRERQTQAALLATEKLAVAGRLAATIAHEIHNPLDSVSNLLYLLSTGSTPEESKHFLETAQQELARVTQISRAMLGLYRETKSPVPTDLKELLDGVLFLLERRFAALQVSLVTDIPGGIFVQGFPAELRQVFTNIITNAAEAAASGGTVSVTMRESDAPAADPGKPARQGVLIAISDNGPGIPATVQARLFQPFFSTKGEQGTGLGLWVSLGIVQKHDGTITLTSSTEPQDHGTTVNIFLSAKISPPLETKE